MAFIVSSQDAYGQLRHLAHLRVEEVWLLTLHANKRLTGRLMLFRGTVDHCLAHPRDIFRAACRLNASGIILGHNHPSGELEPSPEDQEWTLRIRRLARLMEIELIDHLIVTDQGYWSFADRGWDHFDGGAARKGSKVCTRLRRT